MQAPQIVLEKAKTDGHGNRTRKFSFILRDGYGIGALANGCAFFVLHRMKTLGRQVDIWRTLKDVVLYKEYWRLAPTKNWSRAPLVVGISSFILAALFMFVTFLKLPK